MIDVFEREPNQVPVDNVGITSEISRRVAYREESDSLFFKWQRGEIEKQEWLDKVQEIRERFPYSED